MKRVGVWTCVFDEKNTSAALSSMSTKAAPSAAAYLRAASRGASSPAYFPLQ